MHKRFVLAIALATTLVPALARSADSQYSVKIDAPPAQVGKEGRAQVRVLPGQGMHVNVEYPASILLSLPPGIEGPSGKLKPTKLDKNAASFEVGFTPYEPGAKVFSAVVSFAVCDDALTQCNPRREKVQFTVNVSK